MKLEESGIVVAVGFWTIRFWHRIWNPRRGMHNSILSWIPFHWANSDKSYTCKFSPVLYSASRDYILAVRTSYFLLTGSNPENVISVLLVPVVLFAILKFKDELEQMSSSWGWTCFSDLHLRFRPSERVFPFFLPFSRFVPFPFLNFSSICAWFLPFYNPLYSRRNLV